MDLECPLLRGSSVRRLRRRGTVVDVEQWNSRKSLSIVHLAGFLKFSAETFVFIAEELWT